MTEMIHLTFLYLPAKIKQLYFPDGINHFRDDGAKFIKHWTLDTWVFKESNWHETRRNHRSFRKSRRGIP